MQPIRLDVGSVVLASSLVSSALDAYLDDDILGCLRILDSMPIEKPAESRQATLLRARALLRLQRSGEVVELLGPALGIFVGVDEAVTAGMLHAVAVFRTLSLDRGIALLAGIKESARTLHAHKTIRAEISYWTASAYWRKRDYRATLMYAKEAEESHADVITVRAASLRGYVGAAKQRYAEALALFHSARDAYNGCRERDRNLLERIVVQIASLEVTLRSARSLGSHVMPQELTRIPEVPGMPRVPGVFRMPDCRAGRVAVRLR